MVNACAFVDLLIAHSLVVMKPEVSDRLSSRVDSAVMDPSKTRLLEKFARRVMLLEGNIIQYYETGDKMCLHGKKFAHPKTMWEANERWRRDVRNLQEKARKRSRSARKPVS